MPFSVLVPVQQLRQFVVGAEQLLARTLLNAVSPALRAVIDSSGRLSTAAPEADERTTDATARTTDTGRPLHLVTEPSSRAADPAEVRAWARSRGLHVGDRGRISRTVIDEYRIAHAS